jgi:hypothetical protein
VFLINLYATSGRNRPTTPKGDGAIELAETPRRHGFYARVPPGAVTRRNSNAALMGDAAHVVGDEDEDEE